MRALLFITLIAAFLALPWWVGMTGAFLYAYRFHAYELIPLGIFLDALFAPSFDTLSFFYIGILLSLTLALELLKPFLSFYKETA